MWESERRKDFPYPGKRRLRSEVAEREADSMNAASDGVRRQAVETLKLAVLSTAYLQQTLPVLERDGQLLDQIQQVAESHYRVGQGNQQDVLKAHCNVQSFCRKLLCTISRRNSLKRRFKQVLSRSQISSDMSPFPSPRLS